MRTLPVVLCLGLLTTPAGALAHLRLTQPLPRYQEDDLKFAPCGVPRGTRGSQVTVIERGASIRVEWDETVDHTSHYRISFDEDGDDDFADPPTERDFYSNSTVLLDDIADPGGHMSADIKLPDVLCDRCTLQVIQVMYGAGIYYQCADLKLIESPCSPDAGCNEPSPSGAAVDGGSSTGDRVDAGSSDPSSPPATKEPLPSSATDVATKPSGTSCTTRPTPPGALPGLDLLVGAAVLIAWRRRRAAPFAPARC